MKFTKLLILTAFVYSVSVEALPVPEYMKVPHWEACIDTMAVNLQVYICLPVEKNKDCPAEAWETLTTKKLLEECSKYVQIGK